MIGASPALVDLVVELHELGPGDRRAILGRFEAREREIIENCLRKATLPPPPSFDALAALSPWLADSLSAARSKQSLLTPATRDALIEAEQLLQQSDVVIAPRGPSLLERIFARKGRK